MFTKTIIPATTSVTINLPENFVGEQVRLIAVIEKEGTYAEPVDDKINQLKETYSKYRRVDLSDFKFNRDEANDFE
jgi:hypothetical protein